jgi:hypothetical protein
MRYILWGRRGRSVGGPTRLESARRPPECFATVLACSRQWDTLNEVSQRDVLELVCIRSPQLPRLVDRRDGDKDLVAFADSA